MTFAQELARFRAACPANIDPLAAAAQEYVDDVLPPMTEEEREAFANAYAEAEAASMRFAYAYPYLAD